MKKFTINLLKGFFVLTFLFGSFSVITNAQEMTKAEKKAAKKAAKEAKKNAKQEAMMKKDGMAKDEMKKEDAMSKDGMKKDDMMNKDMSKDSMMKDGMANSDMRPTVAIIRADWCPYCKTLEPIMQGLMADYDGKLNFVVFDITDDKTTKASMVLAKQKGLEAFFNENKGKSAFVAILKEGKQVFESKYKTDKALFVSEFDKAIK
jgi:thiol-disulfide isomerase/thioredoxin